MSHTFFISLGVLVLASLASHDPAQVKKGPTTRSQTPEKLARKPSTSKSK